MKRGRADAQGMLVTMEDQEADLAEAEVGEVSREVSGLVSAAQVTFIVP